MNTHPPTIVWRHRRENLRKCSLRGLENRADFQFFPYPGSLPLLENYIILTLDAPLLSHEDKDNGLFIIDATWRYAEKMLRQIDCRKIICRSLPPHYRTAYPRRQEDCSDPERGLASVEAIYVAYKLLGREPGGLLDSYHWQESFLNLNNIGDIGDKCPH